MQMGPREKGFAGSKGYPKLPRATNPDIGGDDHHRQINQATFEGQQIAVAARLIYWYGAHETHSEELNRALKSPLRKGGILSYVFDIISKGSIQDFHVDIT